MVCIARTAGVVLRAVAVALRFLVNAAVLRSLVRSARGACVRCGRLELASAAKSAGPVRAARALRNSALTRTALPPRITA